MCFKTKKIQEFNFLLVTFIYSFIQIIHISNTNWVFFDMTGPRVPKKPQFTHENNKKSKFSVISQFALHSIQLRSAHAQWSSVKVQQHNKNFNRFNAVLFVFKIVENMFFLNQV
jgi:hypothetical protein